eukprot:1150752-Pelagomonas_calceolata.AAC.3
MWSYLLFALQSLDHLIRSVEEQSISDPVGANDIIRCGMIYVWQDKGVAGDTLFNWPLRQNYTV